MTSASIRARRENEDGFTLIELLVVVIIIGILAAIAIPAFLNQRERAWQAELTSSVRNVALEVEAEATAFGGDYLLVTNGTDFDGFISDALDDLQTATGPVDYVSAETVVSATAFSICMEHATLNAGGGGSVTYDSAAGGLQDFSAGPCTAVVP